MILRSHIIINLQISSQHMNNSSYSSVISFNSDNICNSQQLALGTKFPDGPAVKKLVEPFAVGTIWTWPHLYVDRCESMACNDPECGWFFFVYPMTGQCKCLKHGHSIPETIFDLATMYKFSTK